MKTWSLDNALERFGTMAMMEFYNFLMKIIFYIPDNIFDLLKYAKDKIIIIISETS
jgi:hypothetical protein